MEVIWHNRLYARDAIVLVSEAKNEQFNKGAAQNIIIMEDAQCCVEVSECQLSIATLFMRFFFLQY